MTTSITNNEPAATPPVNRKETSMSWLRSLFSKLAQLVRDIALTVIDFTKREPLAVAAAAAIALLLIVKP